MAANSQITALSTSDATGGLDLNFNWPDNPPPQDYLFQMWCRDLGASELLSACSVGSSSWRPEQRSRSAQGPARTHSMETGR